MLQKFTAGVWRQTGAITLPISLILLVLLTLITIYAARVGVMETRSSANKVRYDEAFQAAEAGMEQGLAYLNNLGNRTALLAAAWSACDNNFPCSEIPSAERANWLYITPNNNITTQPSTGGSYALHFLTPCNDCAARTLYQYPPLTIIAAGTSADQTGHAVVKQAMTFFEIGGGGNGAPVPFVAPGNIPLSGNYSIVVNPNGGGRGVPLSVWTNSNIDLSGGSVITCHPDEFLQSSSSSHDTSTNPGIDMCSSCTCQPDTTGTLSQSGASMKIVKNYDILDNDTNFPTDVFKMFTGTPATSYPAFREYVKSINDGKLHYLTDCNTLDTTAAGWYWVDGDCSPPSSVGNLATHGVKLIVNGNAHFAANTYLFGALLMFTPPGSNVTRDFRTNGNFTLYGAILANHEMDMLLNGSFVLRYVEDLFAEGPGTPSDSGFGKLPNTWADF